MAPHQLVLVVGLAVLGMVELLLYLSLPRKRPISKRHARLLSRGAPVARIERNK